MARHLNSNAARVHRFLWECYDQRAGAPSQNEIAKACYLSRPHVGTLLRILEARGLLELHWLPSGRLAARSVRRVLPPKA